jgi:diguanylate cyclase (GGDEF)-like protein
MVRFPFLGVLVPPLLGFLLAPGVGMALDPTKRPTQYILETWEVEQGLPQSSVTALAQTPDGYLWVGTQEGLARFDGVKFTVFDKRNTKGFPHNHILTLLADREGSLWAGTYSGLAQFREGAFRFYGTTDGLPSAAVLALGQDSKGTLWVGTEEGGLCRFTGGRFEPVRWDPSPEGSVHAILETRDGTLWVGATSGLYRFRQGEGVRRWSQKEGMPATPVLDLLEGGDGTLWVGTSGGGVCAFDGVRFRAWGPKEGLAYDVVESLAEDADGNLWVGTYQGLTRLRDGAAASMGPKEGLSDDVILSLLADREGNLWVGTSNGGLNRLRDGVVVPWSVREGLSADGAYCVLEDRDGAVWIGTKSGGLNRLDASGVRVYTRRDGLPDDDVVALLEGRDGTLWVGTDEGVAVRRGDRFLPVAPKEIRARTLSCLLEDRDGAVWMGSDGGGLYRLEGGTVRTFRREDGLADLMVLSLAQGPDGTLWVGTDGGGIHRFEKGRFRAFGTKEGLSNGMVMAILPASDGTVWIGTYGGGLNRLKDGRLAACTTEHGLFDDNIFAILDDGDGNLWMSSNLGIFTVPVRELTEFMDGRRERVACRTFGTADGMRSCECNGGSQPAAWRGRDGRLWFTTVRGAAVLDPRLVRCAPASVTVLVESLAVDGRPVEGAGLAGPLSFPPGRNAFEFHYTALGHPVPERVRFRYRLDGYDRDWVEAGERRAAYYTNLQPGDYAFRVEASAAGGPWAAARVPVRFTLQPRLYERSLFWAGVLGMLAFLFWGGYRWRIRRMERRERELAALVDARTRDLLDAQQKLEEKTWLLDQLSRRDGVTGLANRRTFDEFMEDEWKRSSRAGMELSLLMIDIDHFKDYNDSRGHQAGDDCLRRVAECLRSVMSRGGDLVARYGGEEFAVVLFGTGTEGASVSAEKVRSSVEALGLPHGASPVSPVVTVSVGHATLRPRVEGSPEALIAAADRALYAAKAEGRNCVRGSAEG